MRRAALLLVALSASLPAHETIVPAQRVAHFLALKEVYLNGSGPFRMMVDTGATSCALRPEIAAKLGLRPVYAVEHETVSGVKKAPVVLVEELRVGEAAEHNIEVVVTDLLARGVDGVLGQSWLVRFDYLLDYRNARLVLNPEAPEAGVRAGLRMSDGRPSISAVVDGAQQDLVVDSGASALILFRRVAAQGQASLATNQGNVAAVTAQARVRIGRLFNKRMTAAEVDLPQRPGLLPAAAFGSVYVSNRNGVVVLVPR